LEIKYLIDIIKSYNILGCIMADNIKKKVQLKLLILSLLGFGLVTLSIIFVFNVAASQQSRDLYNWQVQLGRMADSRQADVERWIGRQFQEVSALAENTSLRLYIMDLTRTSKIVKRVEDEPFQAVYLRNLLVVTSERTGFGYKADSPAISANVRLNGVAGIALLNKDREVIVSTSRMPPIAGELQNFVKKIVPGSKGLSDVYMGPSGNLVIAFAVPIFEVQGENTPKSQIGMVLGVRTVEDSLFELLKQPSGTEKTMETMLVVPDYPNNSLLYVSPMKDGSAPLSKKIDISNEEMDSVFAVMHPGRVDIKRDYTYTQVLVTGRTIENAPWFLVQKINRDEALAESDSRKNNFIIIGISVVILVTMILLVIWRHSMSIKAERAAQRFKKLAEKFEVQKELLNVVADNKMESLLIFNESNKCCFANLEAARNADIGQLDAVGKKLPVLVGGGRADIYAKMNATALAENRIVTFVHSPWKDNKIIQSKHIPLDHIPGHEGRGVLIIDQDITELMQYHKKMVNDKNSIIETLVAIMDRRDHFTADHSTRVSKLCRDLANEMQLEVLDAETAEISGLLMNLGKMFVPLNVLTKKIKLTKQEKAQIEESLKLSAELLEKIDFEGPVIETIRQAHANKAGKKKLLSAVIVSYANAFVSMLSPRSYRERIGIEEAMSQLQTAAKSKEEKSVMAALYNYIENKGGRAYWEKQAKN
jgi:HD-GYP domain-containing protein (c-di-GMP phosphodiesterase class II)